MRYKNFPLEIPEFKTNGLFNINMTNTSVTTLIRSEETNIQP